MVSGEEERSNLAGGCPSGGVAYRTSYQPSARPDRVGWRDRGGTSIYFSGLWQYHYVSRGRFVGGTSEASLGTRAGDKILLKERIG